MTGKMIQMLMAQDKFVYAEIFLQNNYNLMAEDVVGKTLLDFGANLGFFSISAFEHGLKNVIAIEPVPSIVTLLRQNLGEYLGSPNAANDDRAIIIDKAVYTGDTCNIDTSFSCPKVVEGSGTPVETCSFDSIVSNVPGDDLVLKMDIEHSEWKVLFYASGYNIRKFETIFIEVHSEPNKSISTMREYFGVLGYEIVHKHCMMHWEGNYENYRPSNCETWKLKRIR